MTTQWLLKEKEREAPRGTIWPANGSGPSESTRLGTRPEGGGDGGRQGCRDARLSASAGAASAVVSPPSLQLLRSAAEWRSTGLRSCEPPQVKPSLRRSRRNFFPSIELHENHPFAGVSSPPEQDRTRGLRVKTT